MTPEQFDAPQPATDKLQLGDIIDARYRVKFATKQATDHLKIPYGENNTKLWLEPVCHDVPPGSGGAPQLLLDGKEVIIDEIFDTTLGRKLTPLEIDKLIPILAL